VVANLSLHSKQLELEQDVLRDGVETKNPHYGAKKSVLTPIVYSGIAILIEL